MRVAFVDTPDAVAAARAASDGRIVTDNPMLAAEFSAMSVVNIEARIDQATANRLGMAAIRMAETVDDQLRSGDTAARIGISPDHLQLAGSFCRLLSAILYRAAVFALELRENDADTIVLRVVDVAPRSAERPLVLPRLCCPHLALAQEGFFAPRTVQVAHTGQAHVARTTGEVPRNLLRRFVYRPTAEFVLHALERSQLARWCCNGPEIAVSGVNEALGETLPWLAAKRYRFKRVGKLLESVPAPAGTDADQRFDMVADDAIAAAFQEQSEALEIFSAQERAALQRVAAGHVSAGLAALAAVRPIVEKRIAALARELSPPRILLSHGLFGPSGAMTYGLLRQAGFTVIDFEHGVTTGLSAHSQEKIGFSEASTCDVVMVCADNAAHGFSFARYSERVRREVIGLAEQTRRLVRPSIQRALARRFLGLRRAERAVMHVSTWPYAGNMRPGYGPPTDTALFDVDRRLITDVYARIPYRVLFKEYPTKRYPWQPDYTDLFKCPPNVSIVPPEDLRYMRAAADIIVTASPTSTLGWIVGADVPIVWLESREINPITTEAWRDAFLESFLCVDIDRPDWPDRLAEILSRPFDEIVRAWNARAKARARLYSQAILGPSGNPGRRAANIIDNIHRQRRGLEDLVAGSTKWSTAP